jgi:hypothetical protein
MRQTWALLPAQPSILVVPSFEVIVLSEAMLYECRYESRNVMLSNLHAGCCYCLLGLVVITNMVDVGFISRSTPHRAITWSYHNIPWIPFKCLHVFSNPGKLSGTRFFMEHSEHFVHICCSIDYYVRLFYLSRSV